VIPASIFNQILIFKFSIAITTLLENRSQINQTLIYFFQPDLA